MNSKGQKAGANAASCVKFEPQTWRRSLCKNCFKTRDQHGSGEASDNSATKKDSSLERNGSANAPTAKPDKKSTSASVENSVAATSAGHDRRVLKKDTSVAKVQATPERDKTKATKAAEKKPTSVKVEQDKLEVKPASEVKSASKVKDSPKLDSHKTIKKQASKPEEKNKDTKKVDAKKSVPDPKTAARDEKVDRDSGASKNSSSSGTGGVVGHGPDGENTIVDAVGNRTAGGVAGGGDTGTGPLQVLGVGQQQGEPSTDRTPRQTRQTHVAAAEPGSAVGSSVVRTDSFEAADGSTETESLPVSIDDDRNKANDEKSSRSAGDLKSAEERRREVDEIAAACDEYDSPIIRAAREFIEDESYGSPKSVSASNPRSNVDSDRRSALYYHGPIHEQDVDLGRYGVLPGGVGGDHNYQLAKKELSLARRRRRRRQSADACSIKMDAPGMRMREDAMAEDTRMLVENLRDKVGGVSMSCRSYRVNRKSKLGIIRCGRNL